MSARKLFGFLTAMLAAGACSVDLLTSPESDPPPSPTGTIEATITITGDEPLTDSYTVTVDPGTPDALGKTADASGTVAFSELGERDHELDSAGWATAARCPTTRAR